MIYVTGDMHGDITRFSDPALRRLKAEDTLVVCGDFGFIWDGSSAEQKNRRKIARKKFTVLFIDGAHENFERLDAFPTEDYCGGRARRIEPNLLYLERGQIFTLEGDRYFVCGGGEREEQSLYPGTSFGTLPETDGREVPDETQLRAGLARLAAAGNEVEYILTHEPSGKAGGYVQPRARRRSGLDIYFDGIENTVKYRCWFFGSLHQDKRITGHHIAVYRAVMPVKELPVKPKKKK